MSDPLAAFDFPELQVREPRKSRGGRATYEIFAGGGRHPVAVAAETAGRSALDKVARVHPHERELQVATNGGEALFTLAVRVSDFRAQLTGTDDELLGAIRVGWNRRQYKLLDGDGQVIGEVTGDLAVKLFTVKGPDRPPFAQIRKTFAGPLKETLTSADHYTVTFAAMPVPPLLRTLTVMAAIVVDVMKYGSA